MDKILFVSLGRDQQEQLKAPKGRKDHRRGYHPRYCAPNTRKPWKGERWSFVPSALLLFAPNTNGDYHPRLCSCQPFRLMFGRTVFSGFTFFLPPKEDFISLKGVAYLRCALWSIVCRWECLHSQLYTMPHSIRDAVPTPYKVFFSYIIIIGTGKSIFHLHRVILKFSNSWKNKESVLNPDGLILIV